MLAGVAAFKINKKDNRNLVVFVFFKMVTSLPNIFTIDKLVVKNIFGSKIFIC